MWLVSQLYRTERWDRCPKDETVGFFIDHPILGGGAEIHVKREAIATRMNDPMGSLTSHSMLCFSYSLFMVSLFDLLILRFWSHIAKNLPAKAATTPSNHEILKSILFILFLCLYKLIK